VLLLTLLFGRDAFSYVRTTAGWFHDSVRNSVPVEFEVERARKMIADLVPEIRDNMHLIAKEEIEVERLGQQVDRLDAGLEKDRLGLLRLKTDLEQGKDYVVYTGHRYSAAEVTTDLENRFARYKTKDATLLNLRKVLHARQRSLEAARQKLEGMLVAKRQLEVDVENLEARMKMVEVAQTACDFNFDDSHLARTRELITNIQTRIEVTERLINSETEFRDEIPLDEPVDSNIADEITEYFGRPAGDESLARVAP